SFTCGSAGSGGRGNIPAGQKYAGNDKKRAHPVPPKARQSGASGSRASSESDGRGESGASGGHGYGAAVGRGKAGKDLKRSGSCRGEEPVSGAAFRRRAAAGRVWPGALFGGRDPPGGRALCQAGPQAVPGNGGDAETVRRDLGAYGDDGNP